MYAGLYALMCTHENSYSVYVSMHILVLTVIKNILGIPKKFKLKLVKREYVVYLYYSRDNPKTKSISIGFSDKGRAKLYLAR